MRRPVDTGVGQQQDEFVAALVTQRVVRMQVIGQTLGQLLEQLVPGAVSERIVDELETVEIDMHQRDGSSRPSGARQCELRAVAQQIAIGQVSQGVEIGEKLDAFLSRLVCGEVAQDADMLHDPGVLPDETDGQPLGKNVAVLAAADDFTLPVAVVQNVVPHDLIKRGVLFSRGQQTRILANHVVGRITRDFGEGAIDGQNMVVGVGDHDPFPSGLEHPRVEAQLLLGLLARGNVAEQNDKASFRGGADIFSGNGQLEPQLTLRHWQFKMLADRPAFLIRLPQGRHEDLDRLPRQYFGDQFADQLLFRGNQ